VTNRELLEEVIAHAGLRDAEQAERATRAVLQVLAQRLSRSEAQALADELPSALAPALREGRFDHEFDLSELYARVACLEGVTLGFAVEHTLSVCQVVAEAISADALGRIHRALPDPMAALFTPRPVTIDEALPRHAPAHRDTLAEGHPGRRGALGVAGRERAHSESVVRAENPHADTKLSSSRGVTQEREHESLATGRPGSSKPLSEGD
jgi:uncharacterized protein (DUF2267 family)